MGRMWTKEQRQRQAAFERRRYPTDLTDEEWEQIKSLLPKPAKRGRKRRVDLREILNASATWRARAAAGGCCRLISGRGRRSIGGFAALCGACCSAPCTMWR